MRHWNACDWIVQMKQHYSANDKESRTFYAILEIISVPSNVKHVLVK